MTTRREYLISTLSQMIEEDPENLGNYWHINKSFVPNIKAFYENNYATDQRKEQAGFRKQYSTSEHLHTVKQVITKSSEYNIPLWLSFVDSKRAFDTLETKAIISVMKNSQLDSQSINLIEKINIKVAMKIQLNALTREVIVQRGVRQRDITSP